MSEIKELKTEIKKLRAEIKRLKTKIAIRQFNRRDEDEKAVASIIEQIAGHNPVSEKALLKVLFERNMGKRDAKETLERLFWNGEIYKTKEGHIVLVKG